MLIDTAAPFLQIAKSLIIGITIVVSVFLIIVIRAVYKVHRKKPITGKIGMVGTTGIAIENLNPGGLIKTHGEVCINNLNICSRPYITFFCINKYLQ
jgi:membrane-bound serine protease (ClpP class)